MFFEPSIFHEFFSIFYKCVQKIDSLVYKYINSKSMKIRVLQFCNNFYVKMLKICENIFYEKCEKMMIFY